MIAALMLLGTSAAFAGDSEPLKAILKAKTYAEAESLIKSNLSQITLSEEKAKAYNKLVELALSDYDTQNAIINQNMVYKQMKQDEKVAPYDTVAMGNATINAIDAAIECNKYDNMPNEKGKVKPKFEGNFAKVSAARTNLINIAGGYWNVNNNNFMKYAGAYLDSKTSPFFAKVDPNSEKSFLGQVSFLAAYVAYQNKMYDKTEKWAEYALNDSTYGKDAFNLKISSMGANLKSRQDSVAYKGKLEELYKQYPANETVLNNLYNMTSSLEGDAAGDALLDKMLVADPNNFIALACKGQSLFYKRNYNDAITALKKAADIQPKNAFSFYLLGACYQNRASEAKSMNIMKSLLAEAIKYYDKCKEIDPNQQSVKWGLFRYNSYYALYGESDPKTKDAELDK